MFQIQNLLFAEYWHLLSNCQDRTDLVKTSPFHSASSDLVDQSITQLKMMFC